jgi:hypothetical protein
VLLGLCAGWRTSLMRRCGLFGSRG